MTEEEMADKYVIDTGNNDCTIEAFLAGLKAGKDMNVPPQWHDLRENPDDLPKKDCEVIVLHENGRKHIQKWADGNWTNAIVVPVIEWCEMPTFKE